MGIPVLILGESGSGKSCSLRNFSENEVGIFNVASKPLPFRKKLKKADGAGYGTITNTLKAGNLKRYVIDDSQYLISFESFANANVKGYDKFTDMAVHFYNLIQYVIRKTPEDTIVYFLHHTEITESGRIKAKTIGKMLDQQLTVEGLFSIVLLCKTDGEKHVFVTKSNGMTTVKTPMDMFADSEVDNDLKAVDTIIRNYYGFEEENVT